MPRIRIGANTGSAASTCAVTTLAFGEGHEASCGCIGFEGCTYFGVFDA